MEGPVIINIVASIACIDTTETLKFGAGVVSVYKILSKVAFTVSAITDVQTKGVVGSALCGW